MFPLVLSLPYLSHWARTFFMHFPSLLMNYVKDLGTSSSAAPPSCWVTSFILSSQPFSAPALDIFTSHVTLHAFELNLLLLYWSLAFPPFSRLCSQPSPPVHPAALVPTMAEFLFSMYMKSGRKDEMKAFRVKVHPCSLYEMVPVRDDSLKHLTHKNEFLARAKWQPKVIHSFEMFREMERDVRRRGVTRRAIEHDREVEEETRQEKQREGRKIKHERRLDEINRSKEIF